MKTTTKQYVLSEGEDEDRVFYVSEGKATYSLENAKKIDSLEELVRTIPIMKDWNWDYKVYVITKIKLSPPILGITHYDGLKLVSEKKWIKIYNNWKTNNPDEYNELYKTTYNYFIRITED